jgi:hypothetical protein
MERNFASGGYSESLCSKVQKIFPHDIENGTKFLLK